MTEQDQKLAVLDETDNEMISVLRACGFHVRTAGLLEHQRPQVFGGLDSAITLFKLTIAGADAAPQIASDVAQDKASQQASEPSARDQKLAERVNWNTKQWYEHVGAWENEHDQIVFGSVMALRAMLVQFQAVTLHAAAQRAAKAPTITQERAWYKHWLSTIDGNVTVDQVEFGRRAWAERARRAAEGGAA